MPWSDSDHPIISIKGSSVNASETDNGPRVSGGMLIAIAAILWSSSGIFVKATTFSSWPIESRGVLLAFWRAFFAGLLILPVVRTMRTNRWLLPMAIAFALMNVCYLRSMTLTTAANAIWLQSTAPWWVFVIGTV